MKSFVVLILLWIAAAAHARTVQPFDDGWKFSFDQKVWSAVEIPHTWNTEDGLAPDYRRGDGWYRREFQLAKSSRPQKVFIRFEGVNQRAEVELNGQTIGVHEGGFTAFQLELTPFLKQKNALTVKVNNTASPDIAPISGDFTAFGGIYREVQLITVPLNHISLSDHGGPGVYVHPLKVDKTLAQIEVQTKLTRDSSPTKLRLRTVIWDDQKRRIGTYIVPAQDDNRQKIEIARPRLWNGVHSPSLYRAQVELLEGDRVLDAVTQSFGLRFFHVDAEKGLQLNGESLPLRGVAYHQDWEGLGNALSKREMTTNVRLLREMGANAARLAHYPHSQITLDLLDKAGVVVWTEIPVVDRVGTSPAFAQNAQTQLREMILQNFNHPSILFWGLYNEVREGPLDVLKKLHATAKELDPHRLTTAAFEGIPGKPITPLTDLVGVNAYFGWYRGEAKDIGPYMDRLHNELRGTPVGVSEYGAGASAFQHQEPVRQPVTTARVHPEQWQNLIHEAHLQQFEKRPYLWGTFIWNFFDFASAARREGDRDGVNDKGLVTLDRTIKKDAFYFYKANWNPEPMVHITGKRFTVRTNASTHVKVYSNMSDVALTVNGKPMPAARPLQKSVWEWKSVPLSPGPNRVQATGRSAGSSTVRTDSVVWTL